MNAYELMIKANHYIIKGGELNEAQKANIVNQLLSAKSSQGQAQRFYRGVKFPKNRDNEGRRMYPVFYIPPYNEGKKLKTIYNQTPKTHILSANMYELEILRLLNMFAPNNLEIKDMTKQTLERLKTTCFGYKGCWLGECFDSSLVVLRFLAAAAHYETEWIQHLIDIYNSHSADKKRPWFLLWYFWLCLSELSFEIAKPEIIKNKEQILPWLTTKSAAMNSENDKTIHPVILCSLRNCMCRLPEYAHIKDYQPFVSVKDGRLRFDINREAISL